MNVRQAFACDLQRLPVSMAMRSHLFSYRTQKLSSSAQMVLGWTRPGRVCRCRFPKQKAHTKVWAFCFSKQRTQIRVRPSMPTRRVKMRETCDSGADTRSTSNVTAFSGGEKECIVRKASKLGTNEPRAKKSAMQDADTCPGEYVDAGFQNKKLTQKVFPIRDFLKH